jgi:hypothetical protein
MVFPAVSRSRNGPTPDVETSAPHTPVSTAPVRPPARATDPVEQFEACLAEVRLLELGLAPHAGEHWATRYWAAVEARGAEAASHWRRHLLMAALHTSLVIAALAVVSTGVAPMPAVAATAALGLGLAAAWTLVSRSSLRRLTEWDARIAALEAAAPPTDPSTSAVVNTPSASIGGTTALIAVFAAFWLAAVVACLTAPHLLVAALS